MVVMANEPILVVAVYEVREKQSSIE